MVITLSIIGLAVVCYTREKQYKKDYGGKVSYFKYGACSIPRGGKIKEQMTDGFVASNNFLMVADGQENKENDNSHLYARQLVADMKRAIDKDPK